METAHTIKTRENEAEILGRVYQSKTPLNSHQIYAAKNKIFTDLSRRTTDYACHRLEENFCLQLSKEETIGEVTRYYYKITEIGKFEFLKYYLSNYTISNINLKQFEKFIPHIVRCFPKPTSVLDLPSKKDREFRNLISKLSDSLKFIELKTQKTSEVTETIFIIITYTDLKSSTIQSSDIISIINGQAFGNLQVISDGIQYCFAIQQNLISKIFQNNSTEKSLVYDTEYLKFLKQKTKELKKNSIKIFETMGDSLS